MTITRRYRSGPIFFFKPPYRGRIGVLDLEPMRRSAGPIGGAEPLRHDALATKRAGVFVDRGAIAVVVAAERDAVMWEPQQLDESPLAILNRLAPDILTIHLEQIEGTEDRATVTAAAADEVEHRHPGVVTNDRLRVDHAGFDRKGQDRRSG
jgi:hypothetical protein